MYNFDFNFIRFVPTGHANFGFIDFHFLQNVVFSTEIGLNGLSHYATDFYHPMKKSLPSTKLSYLTPPPTGLRDISPTLLMLFGKPWLSLTLKVWYLSFLIKSALGHREWVLNIHVEVLNLNFREWKYSQDYNLKKVLITLLSRIVCELSLCFS